MVNRAECRGLTVIVYVMDLLPSDVTNVPITATTYSRRGINGFARPADRERGLVSQSLRLPRFVEDLSSPYLEACSPRALLHRDVVDVEILDNVGLAAILAQASDRDTVGAVTV